MRRLKGVVIALVVLSAFLALRGKENSSSKITIFFTGFVKGNYGPCGCAAGPTGGVSRRVGYAKIFEAEHSGVTLHVDTGNYLHPPGPRAQMINGLMMDSFEEVPLEVLNLGLDDLYWWRDLSKKSLGRTHIISTNLVSEVPGSPQPEKYAIVEIPAQQTSLGRDIRIGFLGIADPTRVKPNSRFKGIDPLEAVAAVKQEVLSLADFLIVLADIRRTGPEIAEGSVLHSLATRHPEIAAILVTERHFRSYEPVQINSALILSSIERGRHLGQLTMIVDESASITEITSEFVELKEGTPEVEAIKAKQDWITAQLP